jgi:putative phosphoribosyl transferase
MPGLGTIFADRRDAGRKLAARLAPYEAVDPIVLALPRGGVPVADEVAKALHAPLDVLLVRKIGAPGHAELGVGAVVDGRDPQVVLNPEFADIVASAREFIDQEIREELEEIERRREAYLGGRPPVDVRGRVVLVIDDGIATGGTMRAALMAMRRAGARRVILAVPVAPPSVLPTFRGEADEIIALETPEPFIAVGLWYADFAQTTDREVVQILASARADRVDRGDETSSPHEGGDRPAP